IYSNRTIVRSPDGAGGKAARLRTKLARQPGWGTADLSGQRLLDASPGVVRVSIFSYSALLCTEAVVTASRLDLCRNSTRHPCVAGQSRVAEDLFSLSTTGSGAC